MVSVVTSTVEERLAREVHRHSPAPLHHQIKVALLQGIEQAKSTDPDKLIAAMRTMKFESLRGISNFSTEPGYAFQQWLDIPYVNYELTAERQPIAQTVLIQAPGQKFDPSKIVRPAK